MQLKAHYHTNQRQICGPAWSLELIGSTRTFKWGCFSHGTNDEKSFWFSCGNNTAVNNHTPPHYDGVFTPRNGNVSNPFLLPELLMQVNEMHLSYMRPSARNQSLRCSCRCLWRPSVLSLKFQRSTCGWLQLHLKMPNECFESLPSSASPPRWTWPVILDAVLGCIGKWKC